MRHRQLVGKVKGKKNRRKRRNKNKRKGQNGKIQRGIELKSNRKKGEKLKSNKELCYQELS